MGPRARDGILALSFANLAVMSKWHEIIPSGPAFLHQASSQSEYVAVLLTVLVLTVASWAALRAYRAFAPSWFRAPAIAAFILLVAFFLRRIYVQFAEDGDAGAASASLRLGDLVLIVGILVLGVISFRRVWRERAARGVIVALLVLAPLTIVTFAHAAGPIVDERQIFQQFDHPPLAPLLIEGRNQPRVVWIIFDELDENLTLAHRPVSVHLPAFDALVNTSFVASNAYSPGDYTMLSVPAMTTGRLLASAVPESSTALTLHLVTGENVSWTSLPTVFSEARAMGVNTGIIGWYLPYCRLFHQDVTYCRWLDLTEYRGGTLADDVLADVLRLLPPKDDVESIDPTHSLALQEEEQSTAISDNLAMRRWVERAVTDSTLHFVYIHVNTPHPVADGLGFFSRTTGGYSHSPSSNYLDNLALADKMLGDVRRVMEVSDTWNDSMVIVTGDESYRKEVWGEGAEPATDSKELLRPTDRRVPLIVKLPRSHALVDDTPMNTILIHDIALAGLRGELTTPEALKTFLDARATLGPSPYYRVPSGR